MKLGEVAHIQNAKRSNEDAADYLYCPLVGEKSSTYFRAGNNNGQEYQRKADGKQKCSGEHPSSVTALKVLTCQARDIC